MFTQDADTNFRPSATGTYHQQRVRLLSWVDQPSHTPNYDQFATTNMSSDNRYPYHPPHPGIHYDYGTYHAPVYDNTHYSSTHHPQQPPQPQRPMHPPSYHPSYPSAPPSHYGLTPQWSPENWSHYGFASHPPPPPPLMHDPNMNPAAPRPSDMGSIASVDPNRYPQSTQVRQSESSISGANQPLPDPQPTSVPVQEKPKSQTSEPSSSPTIPAPTSVDFMKLLDSYRLIIDSSSAFANDSSITAPGRPQMSELMDKMMTSATLSFTMLETGLKETEGKKPENDASAEENGNGNMHSATSATAKLNDSPPAQEGQTCLGCKATSTPEWRRGPMGPRTLCNACGLVYAKLIKKRGREARAGRSSGKSSSKAESDNADDLALLSGEDGGTEDDDEDESSGDDG